MWTKQVTDMIIAGVGETLYMTLFSTFFGYVFGMPLGILLKVSDKEACGQMQYYIRSWM